VLVLFHRTMFFLLWQAVIAACYALLGEPAPWRASVGWWPVTVTLTNLVSLGLLRFLANREGLRYGQLIGADFKREYLGRDLLILLGLLPVSGLVAMVPNLGLAHLLFGDAQAPVAMFVQPLPRFVALATLFAFPITIALVELPTYFAYVMPRLTTRWSGSWWAVAISAILLGVQHVTLPFIPDLRFILWRVAMFIPFALLLGMMIRWRPRLLPYLMVIHGMIDFPVAYMVWQASVGS
jgi:hypothetical protein